MVTTCFDKCFLFYVITGRHCFYKTLLRPWGQPPCSCAPWNMSFERSPYFFYLHNKNAYQNANTKMKSSKLSSRVSYLNFLYYFKFNMLHFFFTNEMFLKNSKLLFSGSMFLLTRFLCFHNYSRWGKNRRELGAYININYKIVVKNL